MSNKAARLFGAAITGICAAITFFAVVFIVFTVGPQLETRFWPVVSKLKILSIEEVAGQSQLTARFTKFRNCEYIGLSWFRGRLDGNFERVRVTILRQPGDDGSPNRPPGTQTSGPWLVAIPPADLRGNSFARLSHRCHFLWLTTTDFWP